MVAVRWYLPTIATAATPAYGGGAASWTYTDLAVRHALATGKSDDTALTLHTGPRQAGRTLLDQHVSEPLTSGSLGGTLRVTFRAAESTAFANCYPVAVVRLVDSAGAHKSLLLNWQSAAEAGYISQYSAQTTLAEPVAVTTGDRLVAELGYYSASGYEASYTCSVEVGAPAASADLVYGGSSEGAAWVEVSDVVEVSTDRTVTLAAIAAPATAAFTLATPLLPTEVTLAGTARTPTAAFDLTTPLPPAEITLAAIAAPATAQFALSQTGAVGTSTRYANDGYNYSGVAEVDYEPPVAEPPAHIRRAKVRHVHQSMPAPTLENGRPV